MRLLKYLMGGQSAFLRLYFTLEVGTHMLYHVLPIQGLTSYSINRKAR